MLTMSLDGMSFTDLVCIFKLLASKHTDQHIACQSIYQYILETLPMICQDNKAKLNRHFDIVLGEITF